MPLYLEKTSKQAKKGFQCSFGCTHCFLPPWISGSSLVLTSSNFPAGLLLEVWCSDPLRWLFGFKSTNTVFSELFSWKFVSVCGILLDFVDFSSISHLKIANKENLRAHVDHDFHDFFFSLSLSLSANHLWPKILKINQNDRARVTCETRSRNQRQVAQKDSRQHSCSVRLELWHCVEAFHYILKL